MRLRDISPPVKIDPQSVYFIPVIISFFFECRTPRCCFVLFDDIKRNLFRTDFRGNGKLLEAVDLLKVAIDDSC